MSLFSETAGRVEHLVYNLPGVSRDVLVERVRAMGKPVDDRTLFGAVERLKDLNRIREVSRGGPHYEGADWAKQIFYYWFIS